MPRASQLFGAAAGAALLVVALEAPRARAHPDAAEAPEFEAGECIRVVDPRETPEVEIPYGVPFDDTEFELGDIRLPDAKTHQFFAFRGALAPYLLGSQLFPFEAEHDAPLIVPEWISEDDVERAAAASGPDDATDFSADMVRADEVLLNRPDLEPYWLRITGDDQRVPITAERAALGLRWDVSDVPPGVYQVAGYVFSPPFNAWAPRTGLIQIAEGGVAEPAAVVEPIDGFLYAGQGRRVRGCAQAPAGARIATYYRNEDRAGQPWQPWIAERLLEGERFELCFTSPDPALSGVLRIRVDITTESGARAVAYSPDTLVAVATGSTCKESATTCCSKPAGAAGAPANEPPAMGAAGAGVSATAGAGANAGASAAPPAQRPGMTPLDTTPPQTPEDDGGGCSAGRGEIGSAALGSWIAALALLIGRRRGARSQAAT